MFTCPWVRREMLLARKKIKKDHFISSEWFRVFNHFLETVRQNVMWNTRSSVCLLHTGHNPWQFRWFSLILCCLITRHAALFFPRCRHSLYYAHTVQRRLTGVTLMFIRGIDESLSTRSKIFSQELSLDCLNMRPHRAPTAPEHPSGLTSLPMLGLERKDFCSGLYFLFLRPVLLLFHHPPLFHLPLSLSL